jgi:hypothetical protein
MNRRMRWMAFAAVVLATAAGCKKDNPTTPATPGTLKVVLTKPAGVDGAILFTLGGPSAPTTPAAGTGLAFWGSPFSGGTPVKVVLTGTLANGQTILTFGVNDVSKANQYTATILQVAADTATYIMRNVGAGGGYSLSVTK